MLKIGAKLSISPKGILSDKFYSHLFGVARMHHNANNRSQKSLESFKGKFRPIQVQITHLLEQGNFLAHSNNFKKIVRADQKI